MIDLKQDLRKHLEANDLGSACACVIRERKALTHLIRLSYAKDTLVGWRAILAMGIAARELVKSDVAFLRETCRKLLWSLSDESGGIGWSAPELLGEIVAADPKQFADLVPIIASVYEVEEDVFRAGVLYALERIGQGAPELVAAHRRLVMRALDDKEALVRIRGIMLAKRLWTSGQGAAWSEEFRAGIEAQLDAMRKNTGVAWIYTANDFISVMAQEEADSFMKLMN